MYNFIKNSPKNNLIPTEEKYMNIAVMGYGVVGSGVAEVL